MALRIKRVFGTSFRSFKEQFVVDLPESGLVLLEGHNLDTGGSSGSGKSTLALVINHALGSCHLPSTELQSWGVGEPLTSGLELETPTGDLKIVRGKKFEVRLGEEKGGSATQKEARIETAVGLNSEMLQALTYRGQRKPGLFLSKTDADKKEFLSQLLNLDRFEKAIETSQAKLRIIEPRVVAQGLEVGRLMDEVEAGKLLDTDVELYQKEVAEFEGWIGRIQKNLQQLQAQEAAIALRGTEEENTTKAQYRERVLQAKKAEALAIADQSAVPELDRSFLNDLLSSIAKVESQIAFSSGFVVSETDSPERQRLIALIDQCKTRIEATQAEDRLKSDAINAEVRKLDTEIQGANRVLGRLPQLQKVLAAQRVEIVKLDASLCPTCDRQWDEAKTKREALEAEIVATQVEIEAISEKADEIAGLQAQKAILVESFAPNPIIAKFQDAQSKASVQLATEIERLKGLQAAEDAKHQAAHTALREQKNHLGALHREETLRLAQIVTDHRTSCALRRAEAAAALATVEKEIHEAVAEVGRRFHEERAAVSAEIAGLQAQLTSLQRDLGQSKTTLALAQQRFDQLQGLRVQLDAAGIALVLLKHTEAAEKDFLALIGREGFLGGIFEEVLAEIGDETNRILGAVANTRHVTLEFKSESQTQKGTVKRSIVPRVTVGGNEGSLGGALSGGMLSAVELAVDLAVSEVIRRRSGVNPGWLLLDESLEGLDATSKEACFELLQQYARDRLILVIDHASEFKSMFTRTIKIEYQDGVSRIAG